MVPTAYREALASRALRRALVLGLLGRLPLFASGVVLTLHVVRGLGHGYAAAGLVSTALLAGVAVSGPWRGRLLDRHGLRRVVAPAIAVQAVVAVAAPLVGFTGLTLLSVLSGLFSVPVMSMSRQSVLAASTEEGRRAALSLDGAMLEVSAGLGPAAGAWAALRLPTGVALAAVLGLGALSGVLYAVVDPPLKAEATAEAGPPVPRAQWFGPVFLALLATGVVSTVVLSGTDLAAIAGLRQLGAEGAIGPVLAVWAAGSLVGGLVYGAMDRHVSPFLLLAVLSVATVLPAFATGPLTMTAYLFLAGVACQPTITAVLEWLTDTVPERARGEAFGWHGTAMTSGSALGAPVAGLALDRWGFVGGFVLVAALGLLGAVVGHLVVRGRARPREMAIG